MTRISIPTLDTVPAASRATLDAVQTQLGTVPNLFRLIALSPAALAGYTGLRSALGKTLDLKTREAIALAVAQVNGCDYCLSAHTYLGLNLARVSQEEIAHNRQGTSGDARTGAAVRFAYEWHDDSGTWFRAYGNENWAFAPDGLMALRHASINDRPIAESERLFRWPLGPRPEGHSGLSDLGL